MGVLEPEECARPAGTESDGEEYCPEGNPWDGCAKCMFEMLGTVDSSAVMNASMAESDNRFFCRDNFEKLGMQPRIILPNSVHTLAPLRLLALKSNTLRL